MYHLSDRGTHSPCLATGAPQGPQGGASSVISHRYAEQARDATWSTGQHVCMLAANAAASAGSSSNPPATKGPHADTPPLRSPFRYAALRAITPTLQMPHKHEPCPPSMRTSWQVLYRNVKEHHLSLNLHRHSQPQYIYLSPPLTTLT